MTVDVSRETLRGHDLGRGAVMGRDAVWPRTPKPGKLEPRTLETGPRSTSSASSTASGSAVSLQMSAQTSKQVSTLMSTRMAVDSVVVNSTGVCALVMAGRAARAPELAGRVGIVAKPVEESRRLVGGVTLRARTIDYCAEAMGCDRARVLSEMFGADWRQAETHRQVGGLCVGTPQDGFRIVRQAIFMDSQRPRRQRAEGLPLAYGVRNSRFLAMLQRLALESGARLEAWTEKAPPSLEDLRGRALGEEPLVVNGTPRPLGIVGSARAPKTPSQFVGAAQMTFRATRLEKRGVIERSSSFVCWVPRDGGIDMGVFYPFQDDLSPTADYYGIFYRVVPAELAKHHRAELEQRLADTVVAIGYCLGLEPVDREETLGTAVVPVSPWRGVANTVDGVLDLSRIAGAGSPIISGDGMTRSAIAGLVAAESLLAGRDPVTTINRALRGYRQLNWELHMALTALSKFAVPLMRFNPNLILFRQTRSYFRDMWAGV